jgi:hypothetical protein
MTVKFTKWHLPLQDPPKFTQIRRFGLKIYHLATLSARGVLHYGSQIARTDNAPWTDLLAPQEIHKYLLESGVFKRVMFGDYIRTVPRPIIQRLQINVFWHPFYSNPCTDIKPKLKFCSCEAQFLCWATHFLCCATQFLCWATQFPCCKKQNLVVRHKLMPFYFCRTTLFQSHDTKFGFFV